MSERFFTPDPLSPGEYCLSGAEVHHIATVRRLAIGDRITLFNGDGNEYPAEIISLAKRSIALTILSCSPIDRELPFPVVVASALPKGDRADFLVEKITELGVTRFVPLITARSVVVPKASVVEKFRRAVIEASKQCGRNRLMGVDAPMMWNQFLGTNNLPGARIILHTTPTAAGLPRFDGLDVAVAVGPEGGFTAEEIEAAEAAGWRKASLGPRVLRVETAAVTAAAILAQTGQ